MRVVLCLLTLLVACGAPEPTLAPPSDLSPPPSAVAGANTMGSASIETPEELRGRLIALVSPAPHTDFPSMEGFLCDGRWFNSGGGHNDTAGLYTLEGDRLCVAADNWGPHCRRVELRDEGRTIRLRHEAEGATPLDYRLEPHLEEDCRARE